MTEYASCGMMVEMQETEAANISWKKEEIRQVRRSADLIGIVEIASILINLLLYPIVRLLPVLEEGSLGAEVYDLLLYLIVFAIPVTVAARWTGMDVDDLMGRGRPSPTVYLMTIGLTLGWSYTASWLAGGMEVLMNGFGLTEAQDVFVMPAGGAAMAVRFLSVAIIPPIVEELCYRGFYLSTAVRSMGTWGAIVLTSFAFWLAHYSVEILPLAFGFGLIGGYIRRRYGSLLPSMCGHFAVNSIYLLVNAGWEIGTRAGTGISLVVSLAEILFGAIGVTLFVREGCLKEIWDGTFGHRSALTPREQARAVLTSLPALLVLLTAVYFMAKNLEAL